MDSSPTVLYTFSLLLLGLILPYTIDPVPRLLKNLLDTSILFKFLVMALFLGIIIKPENNYQWIVVLGVPILILLFIAFLRTFEEKYSYRENFNSDDRQKELQAVDNQFNTRSALHSEKMEKEKQLWREQGLSETEIEQKWQEMNANIISNIEKRKQTLKDLINSKYNELDLAFQQFNILKTKATEPVKALENSLIPIENEINTLEQTVNRLRNELNKLGRGLVQGRRRLSIESDITKNNAALNAARTRKTRISNELEQMKRTRDDTIRRLDEEMARGMRKMDNKYNYNVVKDNNGNIISIELSGPEVPPSGTSTETSTRPPMRPPPGTPAIPPPGTPPATPPPGTSTTPSTTPPTGEKILENFSCCSF